MMNLLEIWLSRTALRSVLRHMDGSIREAPHSFPKNKTLLASSHKYAPSSLTANWWVQYSGTETDRWHVSVTKGDNVADVLKVITNLFQGLWFVATLVPT